MPMLAIQFLLSDIPKLLRAIVVFGSALALVGCCVWWRGISFMLFERLEFDIDAILFTLSFVLIVLAHALIGAYALLVWIRAFPVWLFLFWLTLSVLMLPIALIFRVANGALTHELRLPY